MTESEMADEIVAALTRACVSLDSVIELLRTERSELRPVLDRLRTTTASLHLDVPPS